MTNILLGMLIAYVVISLVYIVVGTVAEKQLEDVMGWLFAWHIVLIGWGVGFVVKFIIEKKKAYKERRFQALQRQLRGLYGDKIEKLKSYSTYWGCKNMIKNPVLVANMLYELK